MFLQQSWKERLWIEKNPLIYNHDAHLSSDRLCSSLTDFTGIVL